MAVLFVFVCSNYAKPECIRMNNEAYTSYPEEGEVLFMDGCRCTVLAVEHGVKVENTTEAMADYNGKTISIVYLLHA